MGKKERSLSVNKANNMRAMRALLAFAAIFAAFPEFSSPSAVPEIKFADLKSAVETESLNDVRDAGGKFGGFVVTDIPTVGYADAVADLVRDLIFIGLQLKRSASVGEKEKEGSFFASR